LPFAETVSRLHGSMPTLSAFVRILAKFPALFPRLTTLQSLSLRFQRVKTVSVRFA
jgi:hypothetical protein